MSAPPQPPGPPQPPAYPLPDYAQSQQDQQYYGQQDSQQQFYGQQDPRYYQQQYQQQYGQQDQQQQYPQAQYQQPRKKRGWIVWLSLLAAFVLIVGVGGTIYAFNRVVSLPQDIIESATGESLEELQEGSDIEATTIEMQDRPGFESMQQHVFDMHEKYLNMEAEQMLALFPDGIEGYDKSYMQDFFYVLTDMKSATRFMAHTRGTDAAELDGLIEGHRAKIDEYERRFLAQEDLGMSFDVQLSDGTVYQSDGKYMSDGLISDDTLERTGGYAPQDDPEAFATGYSPTLDANGTYVEAGREIAGAFGVGLNFDFSTLANYCSSDTLVIQDPSELGAVFCSASPEWIYVNDEGSNYPAILSQPYFVELVKHELSHVQIFETCGTTAPPIAASAGAHYEGVTNSYAVLFLGANRDELASAVTNYPEYHMTEATDSIAQQIHDGSCG